ncbi:MAG: MFS transporter [Burkholderiales bacterium]|nr:MFS transporter [Burkholderiales bacterium]
MNDVKPPRRILPAIVFCQVAGTSLWFSGNAVVRQLQELIGATPMLAGWLTSAAQLGFVAGTLAFTLGRIADKHSPRWLFSLCCLIGAVLNLGIVLAPAAGQAGVFVLLALRFGTGFALAGIYPVGMKIASGWYRHGLGKALGFLVGALVLGTALPHGAMALLHRLPWEATVFASSGLAVVGAALMFACVPDGPYLAPPAAARLRGSLGRMFASRQVRSTAIGYFGHMWELYTFWTFVPMLIAAHAHASGIEQPVSAWSFLVIAVGAIGCAVGGLLSQSLGSARVAFTQLCVSAACCLLLPFAFHWPPPAFTALLLVWGVTVVGDSPQFSALAARHAPAQDVGSVLMAINCTGFALTIVSIEMTNWLLRYVPVQWLFLPIAVGPLIGLVFFRTMLQPGQAPAPAPVR